MRSDDPGPRAVESGTLPSTERKQGSLPARRFTAGVRRRRSYFVAHFLPAARSLLAECMVLVCIVSSLWISIALALNHEYYSTETSVRQTTSNLARAFEESTRRTVGEIDQTLLSGRAFYTAEGKRFNFNAWAKSQTLRSKMTAEMGIANKSGIVVADTLPIPPGVSIADRRHFQVQLHSTQDRLYISRPVLGRVSKRYSIQFVRKLLSKDGQFAGVIVFSLDCGQLSRFYQTLRLGKGGFVALLRDDGTVLARGPFRQDIIGSTVSGPMKAALSSRSGTMGFRDPWSHAEEFASYRRVPHYPLVVMVGIGAQAAFAQYRSLRWHVMLTGIVVTLAIITLGALWLRQKLRGIRSRRALAGTLQTINQGILMVDANGQVPVINQSARSLLGLSEEDSKTNRKKAAERARMLAARSIPTAMADSATTEADSKSSTSDQFDSVQEDGTIIEVRSHTLPDGGFVHTYTNVTTQRATEARVRYLAHYDMLTGLPNRVQLHDRSLSFLDPRDKLQVTALTMIDLDGFKAVNDTLGHTVGDELLIEVARRLQSLANEGDFVSRLGGDEFVIMRNTRHEQSVIDLAESILRRLTDPAEVGGQEVRIGASIGIAFCPRDGKDLDTLLKHADVALYCAKANGRGTYHVFDPVMLKGMQERRILETELRQALERNEIGIHFQPLFSSDRLRIVAFEALARWHHPTMGYVSPETFIPLAEEVGLIRRLGYYVLEKACATVVTWNTPCPVAVNLSTLQLRDSSLVDDIASVLKQTGLPPARLEVEVTESVMAEDNQPVLEVLSALKKLGVRVTLDDFGTGYSSLSYLRRFPFDKIKIDKSFVQGQANDPAVRVILEAILNMCQRLAMPVVGEGVETRQQLALLQSRGCTEIQGYMLARPMAEDAAKEFLISKAAEHHETAFSGGLQLQALSAAG